MAKYNELNKITAIKIGANTIYAVVDADLRDAIANPFTPFKYYKAGDIIWYKNDLYQVLSDTSEVTTFDELSTKKVTVASSLKELNELIASETSARIDGDADTLQAAKDYVDDEITIKGIKVNLSALTPDADKNVHIEVPTKNSELENDSKYVNQDQLKAVSDAVDSEVTARSDAMNAEIQARIDGDSSTLASAKAYTDTNGGKIDIIKVNGEALAIDDKKSVNIIVPQSLSDLPNTSDNPYVYKNQLDAEISAREDGDSTTLQAAKQYTDENGGKIDHISVNHVELPIDENKNVNIDIPTKSSDLLNDDFTVKDSTYKHITVTESTVSDGSITFNKYDDTTIKSKIEEINNKIPNQASSENKLADKGFVNSSIATNTASFLGSYDLVLDLALLEVASNDDIAIKLNETISTKTNNDYCYVYITDYVSGKIKEYRRFKYSELESTFKYEYTLNNSSYTQEQWDAINSGITADNLNSLNSHVSNNDNPHNVTKSQVGLSNVDNTSDVDKPISNAQAEVNTSLLNKIEESAIYTNSSPTTIEVGGIKKGTTFNNMKLTDIIENLLYPYVKFTFSSITLSSGTTFEYGTTVNVSYVRLNYEKGSKELTNVSIVDEGSNSLYNGEVSAKINITKQYDGTTGGTISATLTDGVNEITKSSSISYKYYNYYTLSSDETAPTTATKTTNDSAEAVYSYEAGQYLYLYDRSNNKKIQTNVLGQWADVATTSLGPVELTLASGITAQYYAYRTDRFTASGSAKYKLA